MSLNVGELAFYLTLDDTQYQRGMGKAGQAAQALQRTSAAMGKAISTALTAGAAGTSGLIVGLTKAGAQYNVLQQNSRAALTTLLGGQKAVNEQMDKLNSLASRSPFAKNIFIQGQQQLLAFGMAAEKVIPTLDAVQNAVAATGGTSQQLAEITFVLAQIQAAGKITGQDLIQLGQRGIDAATLIGNTLGKSGQEIREDITKGALSAEDAIDALTKGMSAKFGGSTDLIKQQWTGATDRIKASWRDIGARIAEPFIDPNGGGQAVVWANRVADVMRQAQKQVNNVMNVVEHRGGPAFQSVTRHLEKAAVAVARFNMGNVIRQVDKLTGYTPLVAGVSGALLTMGSANIPVLNRLAGGLNPVIVGLAALAATSPELREVGSAFASSLGPAVPFLEGAAKAAANLAMELIHEMSPGLTNAASGAGEFLANIAPIVPELVELASAGVPVVSMIADLVGFVANLPTPLLAAAAAIVAFHGPLTKTRGFIMTASEAVGSAISSLTDFWKTSKMVAAEAGPGVSTAMVATRAAASGLSSALAGLVSPAGLVGIGLTALTAVVAAYAAKKAEAKKNAQEFASTLDDETGAITENTRAWVAKKLEEEGVLEASQKAGVSTKELTDRLLEGGSAYEQYRRRLNDTYTAMAQSAATSATETEEHQRKREALAKLIDELDDLAPVMDEGRESAKRLAQAEGEAADSAERHKQAIDALIDVQQKQAAANGDLIAAQYETKDATKALADEISSMTEVHRNEANAIDLTSDANRGFIEKTMAKIRAINDEVEAFAATGKTQDEVNQRQQELTQGLYEQLAALGIVGDEAESFAKSLGLIPEHKSTVIDMTVEKEAAEQDVDTLIKKVQTSDGTLTVFADSTPATKTLMESLGLVEVSEGVYSINAKDDPAIAQLLISLGKVNTSTGTITIDGRDYATGIARQAQQNINALEAAIKVWFQPQNSVNVPYADGFHKKDGGVVDYFANGGVRENHVAQIAPAGSWRVWAEPETGGEAYIPLSMAKRNRSQQIMAEVARRFGDLYIPKGQRFEDGGLTGSAMSSTTTVNFGGVTIDASSLEAIATVVDLVNRLGYSGLMNGVEN